MGRPEKKGLDYFPLDTALNDKILLIEAEYGLEGFAIVIKLLQKIYSQGYYAKWEKDNALLFARSINTKFELLEKIVNSCVHRKIFDSEKFTLLNIVTSKGIQKRYLKICSDAKRKNINILPEHNLLKNYENNQLTPEETPLTPEETQLTPEFSTQRKEKKRKVNNKIINSARARIYHFYKNLKIIQCSKFTDGMNKAIEFFMKTKHVSESEIIEALQSHKTAIEKTKDSKFPIKKRGLVELFSKQKSSETNEFLIEQYLEGGKYYKKFEKFKPSQEQIKYAHYIQKLMMEVKKMEFPSVTCEQYKILMNPEKKLFSKEKTKFDGIEVHKIIDFNGYIFNINYKREITQDIINSKFIK